MEELEAELQLVAHLSVLWILIQRVLHAETLETMTADGRKVSVSARALRTASHVWHL